MVAFTRAAFTLLSGLISLVAVSSSPLDFSSLNVTDLLPRAENAVPSAPHFVIYSDKWVNGQTGPPSVDQIKGYNVFALSFLLSRGPADQAQAWAQLTDAQRKSIKAKYSAAGIKLIVSLFGSTETPTSSNVDPIGTANTMAAWVKKYGLDGVDVDYEDLAAMNAGNGKAEAWLASFTTQLRKQLPQGQYILTHAPVAPWFSPNKFGGGGYLKVHQTVGNMIDWYNIQFYNQGTTEYTTCSGLLTASSNVWPQTAIFQIPKNGVPLEKLVIGKPANPSDASNGYIAPSDLAKCVSQAKGKGWKAGVMVWEYPDAAASWIKTVRGSAFPV